MHTGQAGGQEGRLEQQMTTSDNRKVVLAYSGGLDTSVMISWLMEKHGLTEISLRHGDEKWRLRRGPQEVMQMVPGNPYAAAASPSSSAPIPVSEPGTETKTAAVSEVITDIKSPTVGTFYAASSPEDPPLVTVGSKVQQDTIVCIVEAMKVFNEIPDRKSVV